MPKQGFWSDPKTEPKRTKRWQLYLGSTPTWIIKATEKPSFTMTEAEHSYLSYKFYYPGTGQWAELPITLLDPITPDASKTMMNILKESGYNFPSNPNQLNTISKAAAVAALGQVAIEQIDAEGNAIERWEFQNAWLRDVKFGSLNYEDEGFVELELVLRFDAAKLVLSNDGIEPSNK